MVRVAPSTSSKQAEEDTLYAAWTVAAITVKRVVSGGVCRGVGCLDHCRRNLCRRTAAFGVLR
jgi:hypothetical protein